MLLSGLICYGEKEPKKEHGQAEMKELSVWPTCRVDNFYEALRIMDKIAR